MPENKTPPAPSFPWSENTRGIVSVLLVAHLLGLGLIFWGNNDYDPGQLAPVLDKTKKAFNPYLFALWFDRKWDQKIANGDDSAADHALRFIVQGEDGKPKEVARFPNESGNQPEERERWQQFANDIAHAEDQGAEMSGYDNRILLLAKSWLAQQRAEGKPYDSVTVEVRRRRRVSLDGDLQADPLSAQFNQPPPYGEESRKVLQPSEIHWPGGVGEPFLRKLGGTKRDQSPVVPDTKTPAPRPMPMATPLTNPLPATTLIPDPQLIPAPQPATPPAIEATPSSK